MRPQSIYIVNHHRMENLQHKLQQAVKEKDLEGFVQVKELCGFKPLVLVHDTQKLSEEYPLQSLEGAFQNFPVDVRFDVMPVLCIANGNNKLSRRLDNLLEAKVVGYLKDLEKKVIRPTFQSLDKKLDDFYANSEQEYLDESAVYSLKKARDKAKHNQQPAYDSNAEYEEYEYMEMDSHCLPLLKQEMYWCDLLRTFLESDMDDEDARDDDQEKAHQKLKQIQERLISACQEQQQSVQLLGLSVSCVVIHKTDKGWDTMKAEWDDNLPMMAKSFEREIADLGNKLFVKLNALENALFKALEELNLSLAENTSLYSSKVKVTAKNNPYGVSRQRKAKQNRPPRVENVQLEIVNSGT